MVGVGGGQSSLYGTFIIAILITDNSDIIKQFPEQIYVPHSRMIRENDTLGNM